jgi:predicted O-methyltransferase YrrM
MSTLTTSPLAPLLDRLFQEAEGASADVGAMFADMSDDDQERLMRSKTGYHDLYGRLKTAPLAVSRETATLLYMLARSAGAKTSSSSAPRSASRPCISPPRSATMAAAG